MSKEHAPGSQNAEIAIMWTVVAIPLAYGIFNSVKAALKLFTG